MLTPHLRPDTWRLLATLEAWWLSRPEATLSMLLTDALGSEEFHSRFLIMTDEQWDARMRRRLAAAADTASLPERAFQQWVSDRLHRAVLSPGVDLASHPLVVVFPRCFDHDVLRQAVDQWRRAVPPCELTEHPLGWQAVVYTKPDGDDA